MKRESRIEVELATARARQQTLAGGSQILHTALGDEEDGGGGALPPGDAPWGGKAGGRKGGGKGGGPTRSAPTAAAPV